MIDVPTKLPQLSNWNVQDLMRIFVIASLVLMFSFVLVHEVIWGANADLKNLIIGALIGSFSTAAVQYLFGTTPSSNTKDDTISQMATNQQTALQTPTPNQTGRNP